jgi:hypothetical protein
MAVATLDPQLAGVQLVTEGHRLFNCDVNFAPIIGAKEHGNHQNQLKNDQDSAKNTQASEYICGWPEDLTHADNLLGAKCS